MAAPLGLPPRRDGQPRRWCASQTIGDLGYAAAPVGTCDGLRCLCPIDTLDAPQVVTTACGTFAELTCAPPSRIIAQETTVVQIADILSSTLPAATRTRLLAEVARWIDAPALATLPFARGIQPNGRSILLGPARRTLLRLYGAVLLNGPWLPVGERHLLVAVSDITARSMFETRPDPNAAVVGDAGLVICPADHQPARARVELAAALHTDGRTLADALDDTDRLLPGSPGLQLTPRGAFPPVVSFAGTAAAR